MEKSTQQFINKKIDHLNLLICVHENRIERMENKVRVLETALGR